jgi:hypothetical protein
MMHLPTKNIIVKNRTGEDLRDIHLTYEVLGKSSLKISCIYNDMQQTKTLLVRDIFKPANLILFYYKNNIKEEMVVYDKLIRDDLRTLILTIRKIDDKLVVDTTLDI